MGTNLGGLKRLRLFSVGIFEGVGKFRTNQQTVSPSNRRQRPFIQKFYSNF
jgi:hypothetical protein